MTSTEFTIGLEGSTRNSSKVLKPPGGGSSDIFGRGLAPISSNGTTNDYGRNNETSTNTQNRLFGASNEQAATPARSQVKSNVFENTQNNQASVPKSAAKRYVRRNPITGEEIEYFPENSKKPEINGNPQKNGTEENDGTNGQTVSEQNDAVEEEKKSEVPARKPIQTSIRVRNPPGGKSSGIF